MKEEEISTKTFCPTCGSQVKVGGEGETHFYIPIKPDVAVPIVEDKERTLAPDGEYHPIDWEKRARYFEREFDDANKEILYLQEKLKSQSLPVEQLRWVSMKDELPEINQSVIGWRPMAHKHGDDTATILQYDGGNNEDLNGIIHGFERSHHVTHWMPLPTPPNEELKGQPVEEEKEDDKKDIDFYWNVIQIALAKKEVYTNYMIQNWNDGVLIHLANEKGEIIKTIGGATLLQAIQNI